MKHIKTFTLFLVFVLILSASLQAQQQTAATPEDRSAKLTEWMKTNLNLSEGQVSKVQEINLKYANKNQDAQNNSKSKNQKIKAIKTNEEARDTELKTVITDEQFKIYESKKAEIKKEMKANAKSGGAGGGGVKNGK